MNKLAKLLDYQALTESQLREAYGEPDFEKVLAEALADGTIVCCGMLSEYRLIEPDVQDEPVYMPGD